METLIIRDGTWNWCYYLFFVVLISSCVLFVTFFLKSLKLLHERKTLNQLAAENRESQAVNASKRVGSYD